MKCGSNRENFEHPCNRLCYERSIFYNSFKTPARELSSVCLATVLHVLSGRDLS